MPSKAHTYFRGSNYNFIISFFLSRNTGIETHFYNFNLFYFSVKIPKKPNRAGISHADIINEYLVTLKKYVPNIVPTSALFWRGNPPTPTVPSKFQAQEMGKSKLTDVSREMALFLGLENPESFKSHSIRHTAAQLAAENLATAPMLKVK